MTFASSVPSRDGTFRRPIPAAYVTGQSIAVDGGYVKSLL